MADGDDANLSRILLDEFRTHRKETREDLNQIYQRLGKLETTKAANNAEDKVGSRHANWLVVALAAFVTGSFNLILFFLGRAPTH